MAFWKNWKMMPIQDFFEEVTHVREIIGFPLEYTCDDDILYILMRDFDETFNFLSHATSHELACAYEVLGEMSYELPHEKAEKLIKLLEKKYEEHPDIEEYAAVEPDWELQVARNILEERLEEEFEEFNKEKEKSKEDKENE